MSKERDFEKSLRAYLAPDEDGDIVDWLERNVKSVPYSPDPGPFRVESTPYLAPILRALQDPEVETIVVMGNVQSGKSMILELWSAYIPVRSPGATLLLQDIDDNAKDWYDTRLKPLWESVPVTQGAIKELVGDTAHFRRNIAWILGANNKTNLQRRSIRYLGGDECWMWKKGHLSEALKRRTVFNWQGKSVFVSQGGVEDDEFTTLYNSTDRREWMFTCPTCNERQPFEWSQLKYPDGAKKDGQWDFDALRSGTTYCCRKCQHKFEDRTSIRKAMNATGEYVTMNPGAPKGRVGFHFNALTMLFGLSWGDLAVECVEAAQMSEVSGNDTKRREFKQKRLALPWSDDPDDSSGEVLPSGYRMEQEWSEEGASVDGRLCEPPFSEEQMKRPSFARLRFMAVDCQRKGYFILIRSWSPNGHSRLLKWAFVDRWDDVRAEQIRMEVPDIFTFVDSGEGASMDDIYRMCATYGWNATKGSGTTEFPWRIQTPIGTKIAYRPYAPAKVIQVGKQSCRMYMFSNLLLKDALTRVRHLGQHTYPEDAGDEYRKQMQSEHRTRTETGRPIWVQIGERANHLWDCEVIGMLPALMAKLVGRGKNRQAEKSPIDKEEEKPKD
jgi:phage terminase large subunit GpA-like protein